MSKAPERVEYRYAERGRVVMVFASNRASLIRAVPQYEGLIRAAVDSVHARRPVWMIVAATELLDPGQPQEAVGFEEFADAPHWWRDQWWRHQHSGRANA